MEDDNWRKYIKEEKNKYKKIGYIKCPAFSYEEIFFNYYGLKRVRGVENEEKRVKDRSIAYFWTIKDTTNNQLRLRVIIRRLNNGTLHFFSIMRE